MSEFLSDIYTEPQAKGPQLFYGPRYHTHVIKPDEVETYHDQVDCWLWEPATGTVLHSLAIPRGQLALAVGKASADARSFEEGPGRAVPSYRPQYADAHRYGHTESTGAGR